MTWGNAGTDVPTSFSSATSFSASSAARTTRSPKGRASPSRTGPPPASGRSWKTACSQIKATRLPALKVAFFTWHNRVEAQHAGHTMEELEDVFFAPKFDETRFFQGAHEVLDAIAMFWDGLEDDRLQGVRGLTD